MKRELQGRYQIISTVGETVRAFIPKPLPPDPPLQWSYDLQGKFEQAHLALGRLDSVATLLPDTSLFIYTYIRKEAVLSSMIEGTQSSLSDLLSFESEHQPGVPLNDVQEVSNYVDALMHGLKRLREDDFPISLRLVREIHNILLSKGRGSHNSPGEFRTSQNWIGGTRPGNAVFVPPPASELPSCLDAWERFLHDQPERTRPLVKAALTHLQFETIHPFLDGNGRVGRLLITLLLCSEHILQEPMLYLSLYFKTYRDRYYALLTHVRETGDWEAWLEFFADAVVETATQAIETVNSLQKLIERDTQEINALGRIAGSAHQIHRALRERPIASPKWLTEKTQLAPATVNKCLEKLAQTGMIGELSKQKRNRLYVYSEYFAIMNQGTELPT